MTQKKWVIGTSAFLAAALILSGIVAFASDLGSKNDPLVSAGYIEQEFTPTLLEMIDSAVKLQAEQYNEELTQKYNRLANDLEQRIGSITGDASLAGDDELIAAIAEIVLAQIEIPVVGSSGGGEGGVYKMIDVENGKTVKLGQGSTMFLRGGSATCVTTNSVGLIDLTTGAVIENNKALELNHDYACTIEGRGFKATSKTTVFIMGTYTVS